MSLATDEKVLSEILRMPTKRTRSLRSAKGSEKFLRIYCKLDDIDIKNVSKKALKGEYQLFFELVKKVLLPRSEMRTTVIGPNLFLIVVLSKY